MAKPLPHHRAPAAGERMADRKADRKADMGAPPAAYTMIRLRHHGLPTLMLVLTDLLILGGGVAAAMWLWPVHSVPLARLWPALLVFPLGFTFRGLYAATCPHPVKELEGLSLTSTLVFAVFGFALFAGGMLGSGTLKALLAVWLFSVVLLPLGRAATRHLFASRSWWGSPVLVLGDDDTAAKLIERLNSSPQLGLKPRLCLSDDENDGTCAGVPVVGTLSDAPQIAATHGIRHVVVALPKLERERFLALLHECIATFPHVILVPDLLGNASLPLSVADLGGVVGFQGRNNLLFPSNLLLKRCLDLALTIPGTLVAAPIVALAAAWIVLVNPGSPFYAQEREGHRGRRIRVWKLRTMYQDADALLERHLERNPEAREEWNRYFKLRRDPRILPGIGTLLRRTSLDELPQLWNILRGDMSLVGPRPFPYYHLDAFPAEFRALRRKVPPGLTGLWQASSRSEGDIKVQEALDSYYIRNWSLWFDLYVLARTFWAVTFGKGAY